VIQERHLAAGVLLAVVKAVVRVEIARTGPGCRLRKRYEGH